MSKSGFRSS